MATIEELYKYYDILAEAKEEAGKHVDIYLKIVESTKKGAKEKQLASQFITRFIKYFPKETSTIALDAIFDLCEDEDVNIRKQAVKDLSAIAREIPEHLSRIADILTQLLQTDDQHESVIVQNSLLAVLKQNAKISLKEIFNQITTTEVEEVRKRAIKFLVAKVPQLETILNRDIEEFIVKSTKQVLQDVDAEEFVLLIKLLHALPSMNTLNGRQEMINIIQIQSELDKPLDLNDIEKLMILLSCTQQAIHLFSKNVPSNKFISFYLDYVFPVFNKFQIEENIKLEILKCFAEITSFQSSIHDNLTNERLASLFNLLLEYLPRPLENIQSTTEASNENDVKFNFSFVECLMYSFHELGKFKPEFLSGDESKERLKDFRVRLQYFATGTQNYIKELKNTVSKDDQSQENKVRKIALKVTTNIDALIKDLFHNPPSYKSPITLSWKLSAIDTKPTMNETPVKRAHSREDSSEGSMKKERKPNDNRQLNTNRRGGYGQQRGNGYHRGNGNYYRGGARNY